jgi:molybdopterin molybdotransferase
VLRNSPPYPIIEYSLAGAQSAIVERVSPLAPQQVAVSDALACINGAPLRASRPKPFYDQSTRDGFALAGQPFSVADHKAVFKLVGEVAAGSREELALQAGEAVRIMTGAMVPAGCDRVVPFEVCNDRGETVEIPADELTARHLYIRAIGSEVKEGKLLVPAGTRLLPDHLLMLAENGWTDLLVYPRPEVAVICTGSELVEAGETVVYPGQKISGNSVLLPALLKAQGGHCSWSVTVADQVELIKKRVREVLDEGPDMIITTGGMGPGKFDLMEEVFARLGGTVVYNRLQVRPGKFTLFGVLGRVLFFALPGPPPAVRILFHELVCPALNRLQGGAESVGRLVPATLASTLSVKQTGHLNLKGAVARVTEEGLVVHPAGRMEPINAIIHLAGERTVAEYGEGVRIRLIGPLAGM